MARGRRWRAALPPALLGVLAAAHFALVHAFALHPWLGGGFGMFSTVDARVLQAWRVEDGTRVRVRIPDSLEDAADRAAALPTGTRLVEIAWELAHREAGSGPGRLAVEVWEVGFGADMSPAPRRLRAVEVDVPGS